MSNRHTGSGKKTADRQPPSDWPYFEHPQKLFSLHLPRGWKEISPLSRGAIFAAISPGGPVLLEIAALERGQGSQESGLDVIAAIPRIFFESIRHEHPDAREVWQGEAGTNPSGVCCRLIVQHTDSFLIPSEWRDMAASFVPGVGAKVRAHTGMFTTDYFFLGGAQHVLSTNFKTLTCQYRRWAGLFERIVQSISVLGLGRFAIARRNPSPIVACPPTPTGWVTSYLDPITFAYPPDWKEMPPDDPDSRALVVLSSPHGARFDATVFDQEDHFFTELLELPSALVDDLTADDPDARLIWEGESAKAERGRCIRVIAELPGPSAGAREAADNVLPPPSIVDIISMGDGERVLMFRLTVAQSLYADAAAIYEKIARTAVVGGVGPFNIAAGSGPR